MKIRKYSPAWFIKKYWICAVFWVGVISIGATVVDSAYRQLVQGEDTSLYVVESPQQLVPYKAPVVKINTHVAEKPKVEVLGTKHFSRGGYTERKVNPHRKYSEADIVMLASILERECPGEYELPGWDRRLEANVILNRHILYGGTLKSIIEAGNGTQFNGIRTKGYRNREYSKASYDAAYAVLIKGERVLDEDVLYFSNLETSTDRRFINSINWVMKQNNSKGHSFGKRK